MPVSSHHMLLQAAGSVAELMMCTSGGGKKLNMKEDLPEGKAGLLTPVSSHLLSAVA